MTTSGNAKKELKSLRRIQRNLAQASDPTGVSQPNFSQSLDRYGDLNKKRDYLFTARYGYRYHKSGFTAFVNGSSQFHLGY